MNLFFASSSCSSERCFLQMGWTKFFLHFKQIWLVSGNNSVSCLFKFIKSFMVAFLRVYVSSLYGFLPKRFACLTPHTAQILFSAFMWNSRSDLAAPSPSSLGFKNWMQTLHSLVWSSKENCFLLIFSTTSSILVFLHDLFNGIKRSVVQISQYVSCCGQTFSLSSFPSFSA